MLIGPGQSPRPGRPEPPDIPRCARLRVREPLNNSARSAFQSEKPQIVWCDTSDSSRSYGRVAQRARCGFSGETLSGRASAGSPSRLSLLIWNDQTALAQAKPEPPAETPSRPRRVIQRFLSWGRVQRIARSCQRGVVLSGGESWGAGRVMVFQHPSASIWISKAIRLGCRRIKSSGTQAPFNPAYSPSLLLRRRQAPHLRHFARSCILNPDRRVRLRCTRSRNTPATAPDSVSLRRDGE